MGKFDKQIALFRKQRELDFQYTEDLTSGRITLREKHGDGGGIDITDKTLKRYKDGIAGFDRLIESYQKKNA